MKRSPLRSPYLWALVAVVVVVIGAWIGRDRYREAAVLAGSRAPEFTATTLDGEQVGLSAYEGRVVLLNIWATWCGPCRQEMPSLQRLYESFAGTDFEILAVSVDAPLGQEDPNGNPGGDLRAFAEEYGLTFPILHDPTGRIQRTYQTTGVPESFVIGRDGIIYKKMPGATEWDHEVNRDLVRRLLDG
ncbi:MAG TPA: TlpA disulfide reductase family protein [Longimicrobiales bacterium]|nr:TlpA disulfide reductase family protein [Longimicrobiales bacterium]